MVCDSREFHRWDSNPVLNIEGLPILRIFKELQFHIPWVRKKRIFQSFVTFYAWVDSADRREMSMKPVEMTRMAHWNLELEHLQSCEG